MNNTWRTIKTNAKYKEYCKNYDGSGEDHFSDWNKRLVREYKYWAIIENLFPYDKVANVSHILITKRLVLFDWNMLNEEEIKEFNLIKKDISNEYDCVVENLPLHKSIQLHFHVHVLKIK